jgi:hypothetical protein
MKKDIEYKQQTDTDIESLVSLHNKVHRGSRIPSDFCWEYLESYPDLYVFSVAQVSGNIVGLQGMIPIYLVIEGDNILTGKSESSLLDAKYRGGDTFKKLYEHALESCEKKGMNLVWGFTSALKVLKEKLGFIIYPDAMEEAILVLNLKKEWSSVKKSNVSFTRKSLKKLRALIYYSRGSLYPKIKKTDENSIFEVTQIHDRMKSANDMDKLYTRLRKEYPRMIHIRQDEKYVNWRIRNNPNVKYETYYLYDDDNLKGYCYIAAGKFDRIYISDLTFDDPEVGRFLLNHIIRKCLKMEVSSVHFLGNAKNPLMSSVFRLLKSYGFIRKKSSTQFVIKNINYCDENVIHDIRNWYAGGLWTEGYSF